MSTNENEILSRYEARLAFRKKVDALIMEAWDDTDKDDMVAELNRAHAQLTTFMGSTAYDKMKKQKGQS